MKTNMNTSLFRTTLLAIQSIVVDGILCGTCAGLYGLVFGGIGAAIQSEPWRLVSNAGYLALCGFLVGALVGVKNKLLNSYEERFEPTDLEDPRQNPTQVGTVHYLSVPMRGKVQSHLVDVSG